MRIRNEISVGLIALATILASIWGINYLKGRSLLKKSYVLHVNYPETAGLETSAPVLLKGVKIGYVDHIELDMESGISVSLEIGRQYSLQTGSSAMLVSTDLLGTKGIAIKPGSGNSPLQDGDTIYGKMIPGLIDGLAERAAPLMQDIQALARSLDSLSYSINRLVSGGEIQEILGKLQMASLSLKELLEEDAPLRNSLANIESLSANMDTLSIQLKRVDLDSIGSGLQSLLSELGRTSSGLNRIMDQINSGEGSMGELVYSDSLHTALLGLLSSLDSLVSDLNENPEDYVQISVFGKKEKEKK